LETIAMRNILIIAALGVVVILIIGVFLVLRSRAASTSLASSPSEVYTGLRNQFFAGSPSSIGITRTLQDNEPWAILMERNFPGATVTLLSAANGDASVYFSTGGGFLGGIGQEKVNAAAQRFVALAQHYTNRMHPTTSYPLPGAGKVSFYVRTPQNVLTVEVDEQALLDGSSEFAPLFAAGDDVITEFRLASEQQEK